MSCKSVEKLPTAPVAKREPVELRHHGYTRVDEYAWLKMTDWLGFLQGDCELPDAISGHLKRENQFTEAVLKSTATLQRDLKDEMASRLPPVLSDPPEKDGPYEYFWRYDENCEHPNFLRRASAAEAEELLLEGEKEAQSCAYFEFGDCEISPDHRYLAWTADRRGAECADLTVRDLARQKDMPFSIENVDSVTWLDRETLVYTRLDASLRASEVFRYTLGEELDAAECIYREQDPAFAVEVSRSRSGAFVEIRCSSEEQDEIWVLDTRDRNSLMQVVQVRTPGLEYAIEHQDNQFYILTNLAAKDFRIMTCAIDACAASEWKAWLTPDPGIMITGLAVYRDWIIWMEQKETLSYLRFRHRDGRQGDILFSEAAYELDFYLSPEFNSHVFRYSYESPATPAQIWEYDLISRECTLLQQQMPGHFSTEHYRVQRMSAPACDGESIPVTLLYHKDTQLNGTAPCLLEGYGCYGSSMEADFDSTRLCYVDRGYVYAIAHVRGGQEKGRDWYDMAKCDQKQLSIDDFISCAQILVTERICRRDSITALGRSAGGLLVGAAMNQAPELFAGIVADAPFVDVLSTLLDDEHPLTPGEWPQLGNPITSADAYHWIRAYSPYDNVKPQHYPPVLATTSVDDSRVGYWEAAKWVARLRYYNQSQHPVLLHTSFAAGHSGAAGRYHSLAQTACEIAFVLTFNPSNKH